ncbi:MAG: hypothetical protein CM1200mP2_07750 [Planctomycetaceae bacterium]|nr:MAG: hypothetical protein CM1200mP2_07750 [Planctomycetaceae bacterium]
MTLMATPRVCVLRAPGTNCDVETAHAFSSCGANTDRVHLFRVLESPGLLETTRCCAFREDSATAMTSVPG